MDNIRLSWTRKYNNNHFIITSRAYFQHPDHRHELSFDNGITSLGEWCDGQNPTVSIAVDRVSLLLLLSYLSNTCLFDHEIVQLPDSGGMPCVYQTSQRNWVTINMLYKYLRRCLLSWHGSRLGFVTPCDGEVSQGPLGNRHHNELASKVTKELATESCISKRVKRLAGNEIELGIEIPTIEYRASNIPKKQREQHTGLIESLTLRFKR